jgi:hypothetical protein
MGIRLQPLEGAFDFLCERQFGFGTINDLSNEVVPARRVQFGKALNGLFKLRFPVCE